MVEALFEFLFKYRPLVFEQGEFRFGPPAFAPLVLLVVGAAAAATIVTYTRAGGDSRPRDRAVLAGLRLAALGLLLFCLFRPLLILKAAVPQQNFLGVLLDDSRSMRIADRAGTPRSAFIDAQLGEPDRPLLAALSDRFAVRLFRFSSSAERLATAAELSYLGTRSRLGHALDLARDELAGLPLAGLVLVTDGADTDETSISESLLALKARQIPVFTVGVGREAIGRDVQVNRITTPRAVLEGSSLVVDAVVTQTGFGGTTVPFNVESEGRIVSTQEVTLPSDGEPATVRLRFTASEGGARRFRFRVPPLEGETITENNVREALIEVENRREKILYFEGEPRFEVKFIRRAVADDKNLQVVLLQRTAENKFYRLDVDDAEELVSGFPKTREELFAYRGLILGSIEAGAFTGDQLRMIADFVDRRGGGLVALGGRRAFVEGGYAGTPVAEVLPVVLQPGAGGGESDGEGEETGLVRLAARPTRAGTSHAMTQIAPTEQASAARWAELPLITSVNAIGPLKPGATALLSGRSETGGEQIVLALQRYGRGRALAFPVQDSWIWQLHAKMAVDDLTHESFWRQLLRWSVDGVPDRVALKTTPDRVEPGEPVTLAVEVADAAFVEVNNARLVARLTAPSGRTTELPLPWTGQRNGEYKTTFVPDEEGLYEARVEASRDGTSLGTDTGYIRAAPSDGEYFDAAMRAPLLQRIAEETGGRFYTEDRAQYLAEDLKYAGRGVTVVEERELWDMPAILLLVVGFVLGEWGYRRVRRLV